MIDQMMRIQSMFDRKFARDNSKLYYGMAKDCLERARLFLGNSPWVVDELTMALEYREKGRHWRDVALEAGTK